MVDIVTSSQRRISNSQYTGFRPRFECLTYAPARVIEIAKRLGFVSAYAKNILTKL